MTEDSLLTKLPRKHRNLILGIGDDCAIYRPKLHEDLVFTTDLFIEGVHFPSTTSIPVPSRDRQGAVKLARRALTRSLSDVAAMGARPLFFLLSLAVPEWATEKWISAFYKSLLALAAETNTALAGGDLSHSEKLTCDIMVCGSVPRGRALRRDGAKPGDSIYVSGPLGGWRSKRVIIARLEEGRKLLNKATSCIDLSDGLSLDLRRLCLASNVSAALDRVPILQGATLEQALHDGEDYELLYTAPPRVKVAGVPIGTITKGNPGAVTLDGRAVKPLGYDHFRNRT